MGHIAGAVYKGRSARHTAPTHQSHRAHTTQHRGRAERAGADSRATPQHNRLHSAGAPPQHTGRERRKIKSVHNRTFMCAMMIAWSTRGQTRRSRPTAPLAPLREDTPRHQPRQCPLFDAGGAGASRRYYPESKFDAGRGRPGFFPDKIKNKFSISLRKAGKEAWKWIRN